MSIKLCRDVLKDAYVSVCYFGGLFMNGFEATEGGLRSSLAPLTPRSQEATEKPGLHTGEHQESQSQRTEYQLPQP